MKRNKKIVLLFLFVCMFLAHIGVTLALLGDNPDGDGSGAGSCTVGWCVSDRNYGVRFTIVDSSGNVKGKGINVMIKLGVTATAAITDGGTPHGMNRFDPTEFYSIKEYMLSDMDSKIQTLLDGLIIDGDTSNYSAKVDTKIKAWDVGDATFAVLQSLIGASVTASDYLVIEPMTVIYEHDTTTYYYGTARELVTKITNANSGYYGSRVMLLEYLGKSMYSAELKVTIPNVLTSTMVNDGKNGLSDTELMPFKNGTTSDNVERNKGLWDNYTYGVAIYKAPVVACSIDINNNSDSKYNWTKWNKNCDLDGDGTADGCWEKIDGGCCDQMTLTDTILKTYPQCAKCEVNNTSYIAGDTKESLDSITCDDKDKDITNYRGTGDFNTSTSKYCLANNKLYTGKINGKYYGCEIRDTLTLPRKYGSDLKIGQYFVWPTSKTLQSLGVFKNNYPVKRISILNCVAYTYTAGGQLQYQTLTNDELNKIKDKYSQSGTLNLKFESKDNGAITIEKTNASATNNSVDNNLFEVKVESTYTLNKINGTNGIYAYYDRNKEAYTNKIVISKLNKYVDYGYPIIPYGDYVVGDDVERFDNKISIDYGINFDSMGFSRAKAFSGSYVCTKKDSIPSIPCKCPVGTARAGMNLVGYFSKGYTDFNAECAVAQNNHCAEGPIVCPDGTDITSCVSNKTYGGTDETEARNLCTAELCGNIDPPIGGGLDIIYRTIFLDNPFPSIKGTIRVPGANWGGSKSLATNKKYTGLVKEYITGTASRMYQGEPMYSITLTPKAIREIKNYNETHKYDDFELTCGTNRYCTSDTLHNTFGVYLTGGTCELATNAKIRGRNDCRLKALNE